MPQTTNSPAAQSQAPGQVVGAMLPMQHRAASLAPDTFDDAARTVNVTWTTGALVRRSDWYTGQAYDEELVVSAAAVDLSRLANGASVLDTHSNYQLSSVIGVVERAWLEAGTGMATLRLSERPELAGLVADIKAGIVRHISAGYTVQKYEVVSAANRTDGATVPLYRAVAWQPAELSFVPIPADAGSTTRSASPGLMPVEIVPAPAPAGNTRAAAQSPQESTMPQGIDNGGAPATPATTANPAITAAPADLATRQAAPAAEAAAQVAAQAAQFADITDLCARHGVPQLAGGLIRSGNTLDQARAAVLSALAVRDAAAGGHHNVSRITTVQDEMQTRMSGIEQAILHRVAPNTKLDENGRQYRGMSLMEIGRDFLEASGINTRGMDRMRLAGEILHHRAGGMHATGDFSSLFANVANKRLRNSYDENPGTYAMWARRAPNAPDFKSMSVVQLSGAPDLLQTNEHGEFKYGKMTDGAESYALLTYGRIVSLTRQAIINDDLRAFERLVSAFGFASRRLENRTVYAQLTGNPTMGDTGALFNATAVTTAGGHANLGSGAGSALQFSALSSGRTAMRVQKGLAGEELNISPAYLIVPAALEQTAYQLTSAQYTPAQQSNVNEFRTGGRTALEPIVEPVLDSASATAWYLASNSAQIDTVEYCYLDGAEGPVIETEPGFEVDGLSYKCRLDFAAKAVDWRGVYKSNGA